MNSTFTNSSKLKRIKVTHYHDHDHEVHSTLSFDEKMIKLLKHWIKHNDDHAATYRDWAQKAKKKGRDETASLLEDAAAMTDRTSKLFEQAVESVKPLSESR